MPISLKSEKKTPGNYTKTWDWIGTRLERGLQKSAV